MNIQSTLSFPFKDSNWVTKFLIGGVLSLVSLLPLACGFLIGENGFIKVLTYLLFLLLLVAFLAPLGYAYNILKGAQNAQAPSLPEWKDWPALVKDGVMVFAVCLAYGVVVWVLSWIVSVLSIRIPVIGSIFSLLQIVIGLLSLLAGPFIAVALCKMAQSGQIMSSFKVLEILNELKSKASEYITVSLILIGIMYVIRTSLGLNLYETMMISRIFTRTAMSFPLVGLLTPFVIFWMLIVSFRMYGEIYASNKTANVS